MNILFLTIGNLEDISAKEIYPDLLRALHRQGHEIYAVCSRERRYGKETELTQEEGIHVLRVKTGNITQTSLLEKGISTVTVQMLYRRAIAAYLKNIRFDLILYSTPPITIAPLVGSLRKKHGARTYLMLKDIFPQNAVDTGVIGKHGPLFFYFRKKEKKLYSNSDDIGCMSPANCEYLLAHNPQIPKERVGLCPNCLEVLPRPCFEKSGVREEFGIPQDKLVLLYGGNLGIPQGVDFMLSCISALKNRKEVLFVIAGSGTQYARVEEYIKTQDCSNAVLMKKLNTGAYNRLVSGCDAGLIFLDHRFTIPNFPSRLLSYLQAGLPVLAATDTVTDIQDAIRDGNFGWWCESSDVSRFCEIVDTMREHRKDLAEMGENGRRYFEEHYSVEICCRSILDAAAQPDAMEKLKK